MIREIPKRFKLFATTIEVVVKDNSNEEENYLGLSDNIGSQIIVADKHKGKKVCADVMRDSFYHEKVHAILDAMNEDKLSSSEKFVDVFARLLRQSDESSEY